MSILTAQLPAALILDLDGVLVDSEPLHKRAKELAFARFGIELPECVYDAYKGQPDTTMIGEIVRENGLPEGLTMEVLTLKHQVFESLESSLEPVPGSQEFVYWASTHFRLALATSATQRNRAAALETLAIQRCFEVIVDSGRTSRPKPDPEVYQLAISGLALAPGSCWVIEDSLNGIQAAKSADCFTLGITTTFDRSSLVKAGADWTFDSFEALRKMIESLEAAAQT